MKIINQNILNYKLVIYRITNLKNNKIYIGKTKQLLKKRLIKYKYDIKTKKNYIHNTLRKYGWNNFKIDVIDICNNEEELNKKEKYWIKFYKSTNKRFGYNIHPGGTGGSVFWLLSKKERDLYSKKLSISNIGKHFHDEKWRKRMSKKMKGRIISESTRKKMKGRIVSKEQREKISRTLKEGYESNRILRNRKGKKHSEKTKEKMSKAKKGKKWTEIYSKESIEKRLNNRKNKRGKNNHLYKDVKLENVRNIIKNIKNPTQKSVSMELKISI